MPVTATFRTDVTAGLTDIIQEIAGTPVEDIHPETNLSEDLGIDSLTLMELVVATEERFGVAIPDDVVKDLTTVESIVDHILGV